MKKLCYYYDFNFRDAKLFGREIREFVDNGVKDFVINDAMCTALLEDHGMISMLHNVCRMFDVNFSAAHAPCGQFFDLNVPGDEVRKKCFKSHVLCMNTAAGLGCRTYTIHVGAYHSVVEHVSVEESRPLACEMLEKLIPYAEREGVIIAVENSFEIPNSPAEVRRIVDSFASPAVGVCFDTGHANCKLPGADKTFEKYASYIRDAWYENGIIFDEDPLSVLGDKVVTCHIHDNNGFADLHSLPGTGNIDWDKLVPALQALPNVVEFQTEVTCDWGSNWAGMLPAPAGGFSIRKQVETFNRMGF